MDILSHDGLLKLSDAYEKAARRIDVFVKKCLDSASQDSPVKFHCDMNGQVEVLFGDARIVGTPRLVKIGRAGFLHEWTFFASNNTHTCFLWRFYLDRSGTICEELDENGNGVVKREHDLCWDADEFSGYIIGKVVGRLIDSELYALSSSTTA